MAGQFFFLRVFVFTAHLTSNLCGAGSRGGSIEHESAKPFLPFPILPSCYFRFSIVLSGFSRFTYFYTLQIFLKSICKYGFRHVSIGASRSDEYVKEYRFTYSSYLALGPGLSDIDEN